ncbi:MAG: hypothetical protein IPM98_13600 [Lewinellaceae bacterium]|nr:hypothetical protein [Lewinellaceae bacterium]
MIRLFHGADEVQFAVLHNQCLGHRKCCEGGLHFQHAAIKFCNFKPQPLTIEKQNWFVKGVIECESVLGFVRLSRGCEVPITGKQQQKQEQQADQPRLRLGFSSWGAGLGGIGVFHKYMIIRVKKSLGKGRKRPFKIGKFFQTI